ncbi:MAG: oxaloacetate decarboxylase subunit alpha [Candidatus Syntrophonatronum acetioxidans]|uniref:Oxaloacetate decarboxylase subunit alpha n=1 Tax=Candidatus Syntrophonatronum acetioxidans TaxID=1795816 RepID=A0A424YAY3_9FIRM|nr:MAG: oxaloacetate decarboxylase subunit alpha [Candidatus Syntrophonatronum acetioxidans]
MTEKRKVLITDTSLRDAHQSLMATRMKTEEMIPILEVMDQVGYHSLEVWGGATFDSCMRFLDEDPWERLRILRKHLKNTKLQMLLRGQNLVGYRHYADDVVEAFVKNTADCGLDIIRIFDALNDVRNMEKALEVCKNVGIHAQTTVSYTISPYHDIAHFVDIAKKLSSMGADSFCIKDMAGLISPSDAYELVKQLKEAVDIPIQLHCHYTSGMASMAYLKAIEAGVDVIDTAASPLSLGTSQPPTDTMVTALKGTPYDTELDQELLLQVSNHFKEIRKNYVIPVDVALGVDTNVLTYQVPGGMISNLVSQLAEQNATHLLSQVLEEVPRVRADLGYPPLVTPSSQIVGTQAVVNVIMGERYKMVSTEVKNYLKGLYGQPPAPMNEELQKKVLKEEKPITNRPADNLAPEMEKSREAIKELMEKEEDAITYAIFPQVAEAFFKRRKGLEPPLHEAPGKKAQEEEKTEVADLNLEKIGNIDPSMAVKDREGRIIGYPI